MKIGRLKILDNGTPEIAGLYRKSVFPLPEGPVFMIDNGTEDMLIAPACVGFCGEEFRADDRLWTLCRLDHENAATLRKLFPFTAPVSVMDKEKSFGMGDRLGIATPGHLRAISKYEVFPVLAQQSMRELRLTGRSYESVLDDVSFMVFREGYTRGFGADADHLKNEEEVRYGLSCGYSMITLDCSDFIEYSALHMSDGEIMNRVEQNEVLERLYANKTFKTDQAEIHISLPELRKVMLLYGRALAFIERVYKEYISGKRNVDLEISIDETDCPTTGVQHYYLASELKRRGIRVNSIAPRFCGQFQKGIDYIGDLDDLKKNFALHSSIARKFGYKLSLHSGSDKLSAYAIFSESTRGRFHVKTAGTSWLEAMALIAMYEPKLFREIFSFALEKFEDAKQYYYVTTDLSKIPPIQSLTDKDLMKLFSQNDSRQLIHITYGAILQEKNRSGEYVYRDRLYSAWRKHSEAYADCLDRHMRNHLKVLCGAHF